MLKYLYIILSGNRIFRLFFIFGTILLFTLCLVYTLSVVQDIFFMKRVKTSIYSNGINNPDGGFDNVENTKRAIHFYDGQINAIFTRGVDKRSLRPLNGKVETPIVLPDKFINIVGTKNNRKKNFAFGGADLPEFLNHRTAWQKQIEKEKHGECLLPTFNKDDYFALPNMSNIVLKGCDNNNNNNNIRKELFGSLENGKLTIDGTKCKNGGKYSKIPKGAEADGYRSLLWIKFQETNGNIIIKTNDEYVIVKCFTKSSGMVQDIFVQASLHPERIKNIDVKSFDSDNIPPVLGSSILNQAQNNDKIDTPLLKPNVVMVVLESVADAHFDRGMPLTKKWLNSLKKENNRDGSTSNRNNNNNHISFHYDRHHAFHPRYIGNIASLFSGMSTKDLLKSLRQEVNDDDMKKPEWLWDIFRKNGYRVAMNENGCATSKRSLLKATRIGGAHGVRDGNWKKSIDSVGLQGMACHALRDQLHLENLASGPLELCLHKRPYHSYFLDHMIKYMRLKDKGDKKKPIFYTLQLNEGQDPSMKRIRSLDEALRDSLKQLLQEYPNTVLVLTSTQGIAKGKHFETSETGLFENPFPLLYMVLPYNEILRHDKHLFEAVEANSMKWKITTHADVYHTLRDLITTYPKPYQAKPWNVKGKDKTIIARPISLLRTRYLVHRSARRNCETAGIPNEYCACIQWKVTKKRMEAFAEYALSRINKDMWFRTANSFSGCQPLRLSTIISSYEMKANIVQHHELQMSRSRKPIRKRFRFKITTRAGEGFRQERFIFEVQHIHWKFYIIHHPKFNELDMIANQYRLISKFRLSPTHGYGKCLGPKDEKKDLEFCVCNAGKQDDASYLFGEQSNSNSAALVNMIDKDDVKLLRWTHGMAEQLEIINNKDLDIVFQVAIRRSTSRNVLASGMLPAWALVPAHSRQPLVTLEQADKSKEWQWNFDWRWDGWAKGKASPPIANLNDGGSFRSGAVTYQYANGVALTKYVDVAMAENCLYYQVGNYRQSAIEITVHVDVPAEWRKYLNKLTETKKRKKIKKGKEISIVRIIAKAEYDTKTAREALNKVGFRIEWKTLKGTGDKIKKS